MIDFTPFGTYSYCNLLDYFRARTQVILIILHYCPFGSINLSILTIIRESIKTGFAVFFCTSSLSKQSLELLLELKIFVYVKPQGGRDFGSLKYVYGRIYRLAGMHSSYTKILVINDSMISLDRISLSSKGISYLLASQADLCGITASIQSNSYHIQSYHFSMSIDLFLSTTISDFFLKFDHVSLDRDYIVHNGEILLSRNIVQSGYSIDTFCSFGISPDINTYSLLSSFVDRLSGFFPNSTAWSSSIDQFIDQNILPQRTTNPTHFRWIIPILNGHHFVKRELLEKNPEGILFWPFIGPLVDFLDLAIDDSDFNSIGSKLRL